MTIRCAECPSFVCRAGRRDAGPEFCPMHEGTLGLDELYEEDQLRLAVQAALVEGGGYGHWPRLREVGEFARNMGFKRLGIAHCPDMATEAGRAAEYLQGMGLEVVIPRSTALFDPLEQSAFFRAREVDLTVVAGMCVGHEAMLHRSRPGPVVVLVARDSRLRHNPAAALYTSRSYLKGDVYGHWNVAERPAFRGWEMETLRRATEEAEARGGGNRTRVAEAMDLAHRLGASHLGISFCVGFKEEAMTLTQIFQTNGFRVSSVCCKTGAIPKEEAGILDSQKVRPGQTEMVCNPMAQASYLNREGVEMAFSLGQCVGHDAITLGHLEAPAACLVAKDRVLAHNTVAALP